MAKITMSLNEEWFRDNSGIGSPFRKVESVIMSFPSTKLLSANRTKLTFETEASHLEILEKVRDTLEAHFPNAAIWDNTKVVSENGLIKDWLDLHSLEREGDGEFAGNDLGEGSEPQGTADEAAGDDAAQDNSLAGLIGQMSSIADSGAAETAAGAGAGSNLAAAIVKAAGQIRAAEVASGRTVEDLAQTLEASDSEPEKAPAKTEKVDINPVITQKVTDLLTDVPMCYSPKMQAYLKEIRQVIPMLRGMNNLSRFWSQNILVSIDSGFGLSTFLDVLGAIYEEQNLTSKLEEDRSIKEFTISNIDSLEGKYHDWEQAVKYAEQFARANEQDRNSKRLILCLDISDWQSELYSARVKSYLKKIADCSQNFTCVFRVPYMEAHIVRETELAISDVMNVRSLSIPPISLEDMVDYMRRLLTQYGLQSTDDCEEALEQCVIQEKSDDSFFGFKTLHKIVDQVVYQKAMNNLIDGEVNMEITGKDMAKLLQNDDFAEEDPYEQLKNLIGVAAVKQQIEEIMVQIHTQQKLAAAGKEVERPCIHMAFMGNPGTGKTTVARILARIMKQENVLRKGFLHEIKGRDLVGRYVGETAPKTSAYCRDAYGSVLFIDEAYSLFNPDSPKDYGKEALDTLVAEIENHRDDFCVIFAGYKDDMEVMLNGNAGLKDRVPYHIEFPNYSREELEKIFFYMLSDNFEYDEDLSAAVHEFFNKLPDSLMDNKSFSNARFVRNLYEKVWGKAAYRCSLSGESSMKILKSDLETVSQTKEYAELDKNKRHTFGFVS